MFSRELCAKIDAWESRFNQWLKDRNPEYMDVFQYIALTGGSAGWTFQLEKNINIANAQRPLYCRDVEPYPFKGETWEIIG